MKAAPIVFRHTISLRRASAMQVLDAHCGFLSNFEVLQLLREDVAEQDVHVKALKESFNQMKKKRFNQAPGKPEPPYIDYQDQLSKIVPHNVRTLQVESLQYLRQKDLPCRLQNAKQIEEVLRAIDRIPCNPDQPGARGTNALTKTEKLMMVNMAPVSLVDLTIIIDDLEVRFSEESQQQLINVFLEHYGAEIGLAPIEPGQAQNTHADVDHDEGDPVDEDEGMDYDETQDMPDEEYDLVDEGMGDGGRDAEVRELDEVAD